jgi:hypothetical protein
MPAERYERANPPGNRRVIGPRLPIPAGHVIDLPMARPTHRMIESFRFALVAAALIGTSPAAADDTASLRIARHGEFLRIVIATAKRLDVQPILSGNGRQASIALPAALRPVLPNRLPAPVTAIRQPRRHKALVISFGTAMTIRHAITLPALRRAGFRLVLDFAALAKPDAAAPPVPAEAPPPPDAVLKQAGFQTARFGLGDAELLAELGQSETPVRMTIDAGTRAAQPLIRIGGQSPRFGRFQTIYEFTAKSRRLAGISAEWGKDPADPLGEDKAQDLLVSLSAALAFAGFNPTSSELGAPLSGDGRIGFSGLDGAGRLATLAIYPLPEPRGTEPGAGGLFLRLTMVDPAVADAE